MKRKLDGAFREQLILSDVQLSEDAVSVENSRIQSIVVKGLFGLYNYTIPVKHKSGLILLYGDNGCGKTTILNLIYHLLSPRDNNGHRSYLAGTLFGELTVTFESGLTVSAKREKAELGSFRMIISSGEKSVSHLFTIEPDGQVRSQDGGRAASSD